MVGGVLRCVQAKGAGYAMATEEELATTAAIARATGVLLDPVYSGKAAHGLIREMARDPGAWEGRRVLFVHTGGALGVYDKLAQLQPIMEATAPSAGSTSQTWRRRDATVPTSHSNVRVNEC